MGRWIERQITRGRCTFYGTLSPEDLTIPRVRFDLRDPDCRWVVFEVSNGNSDPAFSIGVEWRPR